jgi:hypothetical protein
LVLFRARRAFSLGFLLYGAATETLHYMSRMIGFPDLDKFGPVLT